MHQHRYFCLVCLIQINYIYLHFFIFKLLYGLYLICKCTHTGHLESQASPLYFFIRNTSKSCCVLACKNTGTCTVYLVPKCPLCEYVHCMLICVCSNSSLKSLSQMKTKFTWDHHGIGEKIYSNDSGQLLFFILILSASGGGGF